MTPHFTTQQKALIFRLRSQGKSLREIAKQLGCSHSGIDVVLKGQRREPRPVTWRLDELGTRASTERDYFGRRLAWANRDAILAVPASYAQTRSAKALPAADIARQWACSSTSLRI